MATHDTAPAGRPERAEAVPAQRTTTTPRLKVRGLGVRFGGLHRPGRRRPRRRRRRGRRPDRPERRRQDHPVQRRLRAGPPGHRLDRAGRRPGPAPARPAAGRRGRPHPAGPGPAAQPDRAGERPGRGRWTGRTATSARSSLWPQVGLGGQADPGRSARCRTPSRSGSRWPARWPPSRACCCWTSRPAASARTTSRPGPDRPRGGRRGRRGAAGRAPRRLRDGGLRPGRGARLRPGDRLRARRTRCAATPRSSRPTSGSRCAR